MSGDWVKLADGKCWHQLVRDDATRCGVFVPASSIDRRQDRQPPAQHACRSCLRAAEGALTRIVAAVRRLRRHPGRRK